VPTLRQFKGEGGVRQQLLLDAGIGSSMADTHDLGDEKAHEKKESSLGTNLLNERRAVRSCRLLLQPRAWL
jgi:hypothetical protein